ncbi:10005_t:CDS:2 [Ambispora leptoticha]|uniref:10005_t:CDS:1 n=1 Tax=Ambispora leptoticha TaxID=144679 RepID=A0A9N8VF25_9GLOM|nr:10005_t:CDS:2 [Ambispora leptoticha]
MYPTLPLSNIINFAKVKPDLRKKAFVAYKDVKPRIKYYPGPTRVVLHLLAEHGPMTARQLHETYLPQYPQLGTMNYFKENVLKHLLVQEKVVKKKIIPEKPLKHFQPKKTLSRPEAIIETRIDKILSNENNITTSIDTVEQKDLLTKPTQQESRQRKIVAVNKPIWVLKLGKDINPSKHLTPLSENGIVGQKKTASKKRKENRKKKQPIDPVVEIYMAKKYVR